MSVPYQFPNYARMDYHRAEHHKRFVVYIEKHGLLCQECGGAGGEIEPILDYGQGPFIPCGWCEGTGKVTRWDRGLWLRTRREAQ